MAPGNINPEFERESSKHFSEYARQDGEKIRNKTEIHFDQQLNTAKYQFLLKIGMGAKEIEKLASLPDDSPDALAEQVRILRKYRCKLLDELHQRQQSLDKLDFIINEIKVNETQLTSRR